VTAVDRLRAALTAGRLGTRWDVLPRRPRRTDHYRLSLAAHGRAETILCARGDAVRTLPGQGWPT
jgi:hypothetical protein